MVDTSVVIAGAAAFRGAPLHPETESGALLLKWIEEGHFQWLYTEEILSEHKELLKRFNVRPGVIGQFINLLREEGMLSPKGGGGTDFVPPFRWVKENGIAPKCLIYLTDLCCNSFPEPPDYPVLWVTDSHRQAPFGETLGISLAL